MDARLNLASTSFRGLLAIHESHAPRAARMRAVTVQSTHDVRIMVLSP